ncbi:Synaptic vesicular amine transporter [Fasciola gigantica]|uniref:Synaptic vesicular amine transporter n=1 Tax=Fasciola gigantica TaxID=46835 RepID=A0A504Z3W1_FASGI|nr:Synaptic vesicular amine transporter [Fasciola gigantica]
MPFKMDYTDVDQVAGDAQKKNAGMEKLMGTGSTLRGCFGDRRMILFIVFVALFLDNMLLTTVVPIIPRFLMELRTKNKSEILDRVISSLNESCSEFLSLRDPSDVLQKGRGIWASRGHSPHQHLLLMIGDIFEGQSYTKTSEEDAVQKFSKYLLSTGAKNASLQSADYLSRLRMCRENATQRMRELRQTTIGDEHIQIGLMFASKSVVQLLVNPLIGPLTNKIGYSIPMFTGFMIMFVSTVVFAFGENFGVLFFARALQGTGSACSSVSGMGMLATVYTDDKERSRAFSWALSGLAMGVLVGPPFGGICYQFINKSAPFLILASLALLDGFLQLIALKPAVRPEQEKGSSLAKLLRDPYILIAAGSITFGNMGIAMLEPSMPLWMWSKMRAEGWQQGMAFLPCSISYLIGTNIFGPLAHRIGFGLSAGLGMVICGVCLVAIPFSTILEHLIVPMFGLGFAIGMVDSSMMPFMGHLVDLRHVAVYGSVYAIADVAFCLGFAAGPLKGDECYFAGPVISGSMVQTVGFNWMLWTIAIICLAYAPLTLLLRNPPRREEAKALVQKDQSGNKIDDTTGDTPCDGTASINQTMNLGSTLGFDPTDGGQQSYGY